MIKNKNFITRRQILLLQIIMLSVVLSALPLFIHNPKTKGNTQPDSGINVKSEEVFVKRVIDGDTFVDEYGRKVRLIGIDAPEMNYKSKKPECKALEAKLKLQELIEGKSVKLIRDKSETDKYDRLLRYVYINDKFINAELVKPGLARVKYYKPDTSKYKQLKAIEKIAKQNKLGIFSCDTD